LRTREAQVVEAVAAYVASRGFAVLSEYPLLGKIADLYGVERSTSRSIAIECKERDWRRGLEQARRYQPAATEVFLAVPSKVVTSELSETAETLGIGVMSVKEFAEVEVVVQSRAVLWLSPALHERSLAQFEKRFPSDD
jgi:hypothetical protein